MRPRFLWMTESATILLVTMGLVGGRIHAQRAEPHPPAAQTAATSFDVVVIKPNKSGDRGSDINFSDTGSLSVVNVPVKSLIQVAFKMRRDLVFDVPKWAAEDRFDIEAKLVDPDPAAMAAETSEQRLARLRTMLADRFQLKTHTEMRILPLYELVVSRSGPKMTKLDPAAEVPTAIRGGRGDLNGVGARMDMLASVLSNEISSVVVDKTELEGRYDFHLKWNVNETASAPRADSGADEAPSIFTAVQEQLGLKLQPVKGPVQVLVLDKVERPSEN